MSLVPVHRRTHDGLYSDLLRAKKTAKCGCAIKETKYTECEHVKLKIYYCARHQKIFQPGTCVSRVARFFISTRPFYDEVLESSHLDILIEDYEVPIKLRIGKRCDADPDRRGALCFRTTVKTPNSFQSIDDDRNYAGESDTLMFDSEGRFLGYCYVEENHMVAGASYRVLWDRDSSIFIKVFEERARITQSNLEELEKEEKTKALEEGRLWDWYYRKERERIQQERTEDENFKIELNSNRNMLIRRGFMR